jgi:hypothetical protein
LPCSQARAICLDSLSYVNWTMAYNQDVLAMVDHRYRACKRTMGMKVGKGLVMVNEHYSQINSCSFAFGWYVSWPKRRYIAKRS